MPTILDMTHGVPRHRTRRAALVLSSLAIFLLGTNYCLVAAIATSLEGTALPECHASSSSAMPGAHDCCRAAAAKHKAPEPSSSRGYPCCIQIAPPSSIDAGKPNLGPAVFLAIAASTAPARPASPFHSIREERAGPPAERSPDLLRGRAPPLS